MAKRNSTIYLEDKFWKMIDAYQNENDFSSRNDAIQLILQEWSILRKIDFNNININVNTTKEIVYKEKIEDKVKETEETKEKDKKPEIDPRIKNGLAKIMNSMPEE